MGIIVVCVIVAVAVLLGSKSKSAPAVPAGTLAGASAGASANTGTGASAGASAGARAGTRAGASAGASASTRAGAKSTLPIARFCSNGRLTNTPCVKLPADWFDQPDWWSYVGGHAAWWEAYPTFEAREAAGAKRGLPTRTRDAAGNTVAGWQDLNGYNMLVSGGGPPYGVAEDVIGRYTVQKMPPWFSPWSRWRFRRAGPATVPSGVWDGSEWGLQDVISGAVPVVGNIYWDDLFRPAR